MKNSAGASVDNTLLDLQNSSYPTQPHSIMSKYASDYLQLTVSFGDCYTPEQDLKGNIQVSAQCLWYEQSQSYFQVWLGVLRL